MNPFERFAGIEALLIGGVTLALTAVVAVLGGVHLDGVIDLHEGQAVRPFESIVEMAVNWLLLSLVLYFAGVILSASSIRAIDVLGTQALARFPFLIATLFCWLLSDDRVRRYLEYTYLHKGSAVEVSPLAWGLFGILTIIIIASAVWMVLWMYRAYSVSCNVKGAKGIVSFIVCLLLAEVLSKVVINLLI